MPTNAQQGSAQIIKFPLRGRYAGFGGFIDRSGSSANGDHAVIGFVSKERWPSAFTPQPAVIGFGGAWYHDAAMREAEEQRKN
jgi:hypothetical protein